MYKTEIPGKLYFNPSTASKQAFCLPTDVIKYVIKGCDFKLWLKLLQSCKYFCSKQKVLKNISFCKDGSVDVAGKHIIKFWKIVNELPCQIHLAGQLNIYYPITTLIPKICKSEIKKLNITGIEIGIKEFKIIVDSDLLETFIIRNSNVLYENKSIVSLEDVFAYLPNITSFTYNHRSSGDSDRFINAETLRRMTETSRNQKLKYIYLELVNNIIAKDLALFVKMHAADNCQITLKHISAKNPNFESLFNQELRKWESQSTKLDVLHIHCQRQQLTHAQVQEYCGIAVIEYPTFIPNLRKHDIKSQRHQ